MGGKGGNRNVWELIAGKRHKRERKRKREREKREREREERERERGKRERDWFPSQQKHFIDVKSQWQRGKVYYYSGTCIVNFHAVWSFFGLH